MPHCPRCSSLMRYERIIISDGESCESWACPKCGEVVDEVVISIRQAGGGGAWGKIPPWPWPYPCQRRKALAWGKGGTGTLIEQPILF